MGSARVTQNLPTWTAGDAKQGNDARVTQKQWAFKPARIARVTQVTQMTHLLKKFKTNSRNMAVRPPTPLALGFGNSEGHVPLSKCCPGLAFYGFPYKGRRLVFLPRGTGESL